MRGIISPFALAVLCTLLPMLVWFAIAYVDVKHGRKDERK